MSIKTITSKRDSRDGFTLHEVDIGQWRNTENLARLEQRKPFIEFEAMSSILEHERITSMIVYK